MKLMLAFATAVSAQVISEDLSDQEWQDTEITTNMWQMISNSNQESGNRALMVDLMANPTNGFLRSNDGRGALWWAWESQNIGALALLKKFKVDILSDEPDGSGMLAREFCDKDDDCNVEKMAALAEEEEKLLDARIAEFRKLQEEHERQLDMELDLDDFDIDDDDF